MSKISYTKDLKEAGVTEGELEEFEFTDSDVRKLSTIIRLENKFSNSSTSAHHRKEQSSILGEKYKFSDLCDNEVSILSGFESGKARFYTTLYILKFREEIYDGNSLLIASAAVEAGATACNIKMDLVMLNMARSIMIKNLAVQSKILSKTEEDHPPQALYAVLTLNNLALINFKISNKPLGLELYKQAWLMANKFFISVDNPVMDNIKVVLDKYVEGYTSDSNSSCSYIVDRGIDLEDNIILLIKSAIQKLIIKPCTTLVENDKWDNTLVSYGLGSYLTPKHIAKVLKKSLTKISDDIVKEAQMLCFQQICVVTETSSKTGCL